MSKSVQLSQHTWVFKNLVREAKVKLEIEIEIESNDKIDWFV